MSVQLIVYPQSYDGSFNAISTSTSEFIVNGISFDNLNSTGTYTSAASSSVAADVFTNAPPSISNTWYRFRTSAYGTPAYPSEVSGSLVLNSVATTSQAGIYQKLSNLVSGQQYTITINLDITSSGLVVMEFANGTNVHTIDNGLATNTQITKTFTAVTTTDTAMVYYTNSIASSISILDISIQPVIGSDPSGAIQVLGNGQTIVDLYEDEDLPLTLSVDNFKNVAEKVQSYSKAFNLPATKRNNKIFDQIFEITRNYDGVIFNPYKKTQCVLKQDGFILFTGFLRLLDVTDKDGEISYNVNLYSEVVALADFLKDRDFRELDFTELTHDYQKTNIKNSWNDSGTGITYTNPSTSGFRDAYTTVKYPFVNWNNQIIIAATGGTPTAGNPQLNSLETAFRPFINIKYIIDRIFENTPFTYESDFFDEADFNNLYMDFNWGSGNAPVVFNSSTNITRNSLQTLTSSYTTLDFDSSTPPSEFGYSAGIFTAQVDSQIYNISFDMIFKTPTTPQTLDVQWLINGVPSYVVNGQVVNPSTSGYNYSGNFTATLSVGDTILCQAKTSGTTMYLEGGSNIIATTSSDQTTNSTLLQTLRGELGQWDFLKGLITMFNLVTIPDEDNPNNIKIEPYSDVFITSTDSIELDWTDKIDVSEMKLEPLSDLNKRTIFKFVEDDDDSAFTQYKNQVGGHLYGSKKYNAGNEFNILEGLDEIIAEPFAATVVKPLMSQFPQFITPALYSYNSDDDTSEGFENSPRIMYNNGIKSTGASYHIPAQNGLFSENQDDFLQFSHIKDGGLVLSDYADFHFGECQLLSNTASTPFNLFNLYWLPYYSELYNPDTRTMTIKVNLSPSDINTFKFNDTIFIKNRVFRVNKIDYKPNDLATVEFILIP
tara:strand:+ start:1587 stop:4244 length:2658 start_codon:yes stop_codon:yes gene_type:complete